MNLVETIWLSEYPIPTEIVYDQGKEFIGHKFRKYLIEMEYGITAKPSTSGNPMSNAVLEMIHQVLGNQVRTFNISTQTYVKKRPHVQAFYMHQCLQFAHQLIGKNVIVQAN